MTRAMYSPSLRAADEAPPFFLFMHTYAIHCPYDPPEEHAEVFRTPDETWLETEGKCGSGGGYNSMELEPGHVELISNRYDAGIHHADELLGAFLDDLEAASQLDDTLVVILSDHGEELFEHGRIGHEKTLHREVLHVPLIVAGAGVQAQRFVEPVGLIDVTPTLLDVLKLPVPPELDGQSFASVLRGEAPPERSEPRVSELEWKTRLFFRRLAHPPADRRPGHRHGTSPRPRPRRRDPGAQRSAVELPRLRLENQARERRHDRRRDTR